MTFYLFIYFAIGLLNKARVSDEMARYKKQRCQHNTFFKIV